MRGGLMAKKQKHEAVGDSGRPVAGLVEAAAVAPPVERPAGVVVLLVDRLNAQRRWCPAGTVIGPNIEGWPAHRVQLHVQHGYARQQETV